jgi:GAF domain-containing protein
MLIPSFSEEARLVALRASGLFDIPYDQDVADLVGLAAQICQTPHAAISLLDAMWEWEPSGGRMTRIRPRSHALGGWITTQQGPRVVADTHADPLFQETLPSAPSCGFYAGVPLIQHDGFALGTLYVTDVTARTVTDRQIAALVTLSRQIMAPR